MPNLKRKPLQSHEIDAIFKRVQHKKHTPEQALNYVNNRRRNKKYAKDISISAVHRLLAGETHQRDKKDKRGRPAELTKRDLQILNQTRLRLLRQASGETRVEYRHVLDAALPKLSCTPSQRTVEQKFREMGVAFRKPRDKIFIGKKDARTRNKVCKKWKNRPNAYWRKKTYIDHKKFPRPLTPAQRSRYMQTRVPGHLRTKEEGIDRGCTRPRQPHSFMGVPSTHIGAAIAGDKVILWHEEKSKWNGNAASAFYRGPLLKALKRTHGDQRFYHIVEDGDRKGYQSKKGIVAKKAVGIRSTVLPPRSPSLMPLDFSIWSRILERMDKSAPSTGTETVAAFNARLRQAARLPKGVVSSAIAKMRPNIAAIVDAGGYIPRGD